MAHQGGARLLHGLALCALLLAASCRGRPLHDKLDLESGCDPRTMLPGEVRAHQVACDDELLPGGEARRSDWILGNAQVRYLFRAPSVSLTRLGLGGGTLIDAGTSTGQDSLLELIPLFEGGSWLEDPVLEVERGEGEASLILRGLTRSVPGLEGPEGEEASLRWTLEADSPLLRAQGADALLVIPMAGALLEGPLLRRQASSTDVVGFDSLNQDLGGAIVYDGDRLAVGDASAVQAALWPDGPFVSGTTEGESVQALKGQESAGWLPVWSDGRFEGYLPAGTDGLRALAEGYGPGAVVAPDTELLLPIGEEGWVRVRAGDGRGEGQPARLLLEDDQGNAREFAIPREGLSLPFGPGTWRVTLGSGPMARRRVLDPFEVPRYTLIEEILPRVELPQGWLLADLDLRVSPSLDERSDPSERLALAAAEGVSFVVLTATDEIASGSADRPWDEQLWVRAGSATSTAEFGDILSWPWTATAKKAAHGAVPWEGHPAQDLLALARGGSGRDRFLVVEPEWVLAAGPSWSWDPIPNALRMDSIDDLPLYLSLLESWTRLSAVGPWTWLQVEDPSSWAAVEAEEAIIQARTQASTGPFLDLLVNGEGPGALLERAPGYFVHLEVLAPDWMPLTGAALVVDGEVWRSWDLQGQDAIPRVEFQGLVQAGQSVLAVAWGDEDPGFPGRGAPFAVTSPVWVARP